MNPSPLFRAAPLAVAAVSSLALRLALVPAHAADAPPPVGIDQLLAQARRGNPELRALRAEAGLGRARLLSAGARPNPRLEVGARSDALTGNDGEYGASIGVSQQFAVTDRIARQQDVARVDIDLAAADAADAERRVDGEIVADAFHLLVLERRIDAREHLVATLRPLAAATRARFAAAEVSELDVDAVALDLQRLEQELQDLRARHAATVDAINRLAGRPPQSPLRLGDALPDPAQPLPELAALQARALRARPDLRAARLQGRRAEADAALAHAAQWEDWNAGVALNRDRPVLDGVPPQRGSWTIAFNLSIPLPLVNCNEGGIAEAQAESERAAAREQARRAAIEAEVTQAHAEATALRRQLTRYDTELRPLARRAADLARRGYAQGLTPLTEVMQAQRRQAELDDAWLDLLDRYALALARLRAAVGDDFASEDS